jgi:hypothetical protein
MLMGLLEEGKVFYLWKNQLLLNVNGMLMGLQGR